MKRDFFLRLPQPVAMLLLSSLLDLTSAHNIYPLPRRTLPSSQPFATKTLSHHAIDVVPYPPAPTSPPRFGSDLRRQGAFNTICGYLGGDPNLPATCGAGSHCVLDTEHGAVGCCPDPEPVCTTGVFTACIDGNSPPQTEIDPYVFTCHGGNVCYKNQFAGGFFQFGCGTASDMATSVLASASGITVSLDRPTLTFSFTETPVSLAEPTTLAPVTVAASMTPQWTSVETSSHSSEVESSSTLSSSRASTTAVTTPSRTSSTRSSTTKSSSKTWSSSSTLSSSRASTTAVTTPSRTSSTRSSTTKSSSKTSSSSSVSSTASSSSTSTSRSSSSSSSSSSATSTTFTASNTTPSITSPTSNTLTSSTSAPTTNEPHCDHTGAIVGGTISGVAVLVALIALAFYLWRRRARKAGNARLGPPGGPAEYISPDRGPGFASLRSYDQDGWGAGGQPTQTAREYRYPPATTGTGYLAPYQYPRGYGAAAPAVPPRPGRGLYDEPEPEISDHDQIPLTREIDDFSRGFHDALGRIGEEDESGNSFYGNRTNVNEGNGVNGGGADVGPAGPYGGVRPLWQQQRMQSRNLMWM